MKHNTVLLSFLLIISCFNQGIAQAQDNYNIPIDVSVRYSFVVTPNGIQVLDAESRIVAAVVTEEEGPYEMDISNDRTKLFLENEDGIRYTIDISLPHNPIIIDRVDPRMLAEDYKKKALDDFTPEAFDDLFPICNSGYSYSGFTEALSELKKITIEIYKRFGSEGNDKKQAAQSYRMVRKVDGVISGEYISSEDYDEGENAEKPESCVKIVNFNAFYDTGNYDDDIIQLCSFLAYISYETASGDPEYLRRDGLYYLREKGAENSNKYDILGAITDAEMNKEEHYFGRGAGQLKYAYNYALFSFVFYGDMQTLLDDPDQVAEDPVLAIASAIFAWVFKIEYGVDSEKGEKQLEKRSAEIDIYFKSYCEYFGVVPPEQEKKPE